MSWPRPSARRTCCPPPRRHRRHVTFAGPDAAAWDSNTQLSVFSDARSVTITATVGCRLPEQPGG
nr:hypothetical protein [Nocardia sp. CY41]